MSKLDDCIDALDSLNCRMDAAERREAKIYVHVFRVDGKWFYSTPSGTQFGPFKDDGETEAHLREKGFYPKY